MREHIKGGALTETTFFVLLSVYQPNHGYGIMQFIEMQTKGRLLMGAGTLYGAINTLLKKGWIAPYGAQQNQAKKEYLITAEGREIAENELIRLKELYQTASEIMKGGACDDQKSI